jgi:hypothetical protein
LPGTFPSNQSVANATKRTTTTNKKPKHKRLSKTQLRKRQNATTTTATTVPRGRKYHGPPLPPRVKVIIRAIRNATAFGTVSQLLNDVLRPLVSRTNDALLMNNHKISGNHSAFLNGINSSSSSTTATVITHCPLMIDEDSVSYHIRNELAHMDIQRQHQQESESNDANHHSVALTAAPSQDMDNRNQNDVSIATNEGNTVSHHNTLATSESSVKTASSSSSSANKGISLSVLYAIPPKKTHRRGEKPGCIYLMFYAPRLEHATSISVPATVSEAQASTTKHESDDINKDTKQGSCIDVAGTNDASLEMANTAPTLVTSTKTIPQKSPLPVSYHHQTNQRKLWLSRAIETMNTIAATSVPSTSTASGTSPIPISSSSTIWPSGMMVQEARNQKSFKIYTSPIAAEKRAVKGPSRFHRNALDGTIYESNDYVEFIASTKRMQDELMARPRPAPGGGNSATTSSSNKLLSKKSISALTSNSNVDTTTTATTSSKLDVNGQPIAAIVLHLQAQQQQKLLLKQQEQQKQRDTRKTATSGTQQKKNASKPPPTAIDDRKRFTKRTKPASVSSFQAKATEKGTRAKGQGTNEARPKRETTVPIAKVSEKAAI